MLTFVLLVVLGGGIAAYAVTESESSQRATKRDDLHGSGDDDGDDETDIVPQADRSATVRQRPPEPIVAEAPPRPPVELPAPRPADRGDLPSASDTEVATRTRRSASPARDRQRRPGGRAASHRASAASVEQRRLRDERARQLEAVVVAGPVPGDVGDVAPARTAIEGRYADVAHTALWRRLLSLIAIVGVVFGMVLVGTLAIFVAVAVGADVISNAI